MKLGGRCIVQKSWPTSNLGVIAPPGCAPQNVALGYDVGKISATCHCPFVAESNQHYHSSHVCVCVCVLQSDVYSQLPYHETVPCSSKDLQLPGWMTDGHLLRRRPQQVAATPKSARVVADRQPAQASRKVRTLSAKQAALAAAAKRRQDCTYDASPTDRRNRRSVAATL